MHHKRLFLFVSHTILAACLKRAKVEAKSLSGIEATGKRSLVHGIVVNFIESDLAALPKGHLDQIVLLPEVLSVVFGNRIPGVIYGLDDFHLVDNGVLQASQVVSPLVDIEVQVQLQAISLDDVVTIALHGVVQFVLLVEQVLRTGVFHSFWDARAYVESLDVLHRLALPAFHTCDDLLVLGDILSIISVVIILVDFTKYKAYYRKSAEEAKEAKAKQERERKDQHGQEKS